MHLDSNTNLLNGKRLRLDTDGMGCQPADGPRPELRMVVQCHRGYLQDHVWECFPCHNDGTIRMSLTGSDKSDVASVPMESVN